MTSQLLPKHCAESISAARHRKQKKPPPKKGEVQKEKAGAESLRKDRTITTKSARFLLTSSPRLALEVVLYFSVLLIECSVDIVYPYFLLTKTNSHNKNNT